MMSESNSSTYSFNVYFKIKFLFDNSFKEKIFDDLSSAKEFVESGSANNYKILTIVCYFQATAAKSNSGMNKIPNKKFAELSFDEGEFLEISQNLIDSLWGEAERQIDDYMSKEYFERS